MKKASQGFLSGLVAMFFLASIASAQEQTEVTIHMEKDGKVVKDTTYRFENDADAENAVRMFEMLSGDGLKEMEYNYTMALSDDDEGKAMVFISKDGKKTEVKQMEGDSLVWVSEGEEGDGPVKVMKYKVKKDGEGDGEHVVVVTSGSGGTFDVVVKDEENGEPVTLEKRVKVIVTEDENGEKQVTKEETIEQDEEVYVISGDDTEKELKEMLEKIKEDDEGQDVKVIVIKKKDKSMQ
ncbi:MAG: hypothetical protein ACWGNV_11570 [Bacteroidales bacterium]